MTKFIPTLRTLLAGLGFLLVAIVSVCYWGRFDACTAVTVYPAWCWFIAGLLLCFLCYSKSTVRLSFGLLALWLAFLLIFADTPMSLVRGCFPSPQRSHTVRIVSLNCAGSVDAAREVIPFQPDIVMLQERPRRDQVSALAKEIYGPEAHIHVGPDAMLIAPGEITPVATPAEFRENYVHVRVTLAEGKRVEVICLRLFPCPVRMDLWNSECWRVYEDNRRKRRGQLQKVVRQLATIPHDSHVIFGGDFNAPPGDAVFRLLRPRLSDSFAVAGRGWGKTIVNEYPVLRIDQIWASDGIEPISVFAVPTRHSDHRMVVADVVIGLQRL